MGRSAGQAASTGGTGPRQRVASVADDDLAHLAVPDRLAVLVERVRELLAADTAAVLVLDEAAGDLVATAASGIEEEVRQGVRVPLGEGFAGRIAAALEPLAVEDVDHATVGNPILRQRGIRSLLGAPLVVNGRLIGVVHVGSLTRRSFTPGDVESLTRAAGRIAVAVDARQAAVDRAAAVALQRSLVPGRLPAVPGLDVASRYLPADAGGVGGDWYDLFVLPSGHVGVVIGDVVGRGLAAAVVMGRLRSALRAYAIETIDPAEVVERLDRKLQHFEAGHLTTVLYGVLDPLFERLTLCSAGHPLPVVLRAGADPVWLADRVDPPLGVAPGVRRHGLEVEVGPDTTVALFTDGLVERPGEVLGTGVERLIRSLVRGSAEESCASAIASLVGNEDRLDDVALLVLRRAGDGPMTIEVPAVPASLASVRASLRRWMAWGGIGAEDQQRILLAVGEAASNAVEHAYGASNGVVTIAVEPTDAGVDVRVQDDGHWRSAPRGENRGRGMSIIDECADEVRVEAGSSGTVVHLRFVLDRGPGA